MKHDLSPNQVRLLERMQRINFGRMKGLHFRDGEPTFDPPPRVVRKVNFGGENGSRRELKLKDFKLKDNPIKFLSELRRLENGIVECIEIQHGLPVSMEVQDMGQM